MVPFNQNDLAIKAFDKARCVVIPCLPYHIPQNIDVVTFANLCIPPADHLRIHFFYRGKGAVIKPDDPFMPEMIIACILSIFSFYAKSNIVMWRIANCLMPTVFSIACLT